MNFKIDWFALAFSRFALFLVYFWFGLLKILESSPINPMVLELIEHIAPFINKEIFILFFGLFEVVIGGLFLLPFFDKLSLSLLAIHLSSSILPLFLMSEFTWQSFLVPTLEGQYILKNVLILSAALHIAARMKKH